MEEVRLQKHPLSAILIGHRSYQQQDFLMEYVESWVIKIVTN